VKTCLDRLFSLPLSLCLISEIWNIKRPEFSCMNEIGLVKRRLENLEIIMLASIAGYLPLQLLFVETLEVLHTLCVTDSAQLDRDTSGAIAVGEVVDLSGVAPQLCSASFPTYFMWNTFFNIPWSQLTHLSFAVARTGSYNILRRCLYLECLDIITDVWEYDGDDLELSFALSQPPLTLHTLCHFGLTLVSNVHVASLIVPLFQPLAFPALTSLKIEFKHHYTFFSPVDISPFRGRCPNIDHLELSHAAVTSDELILLLHSFPALKALTLSNCMHCIDDQFLQALQYHKSEAELLVPLLEGWLGCTSA
jgi:hypothetical protein